MKQSVVDVTTTYTSQGEIYQFPGGPFLAVSPAQIAISFGTAGLQQGIRCDYSHLGRKEKQGALG